MKPLKEIAGIEFVKFYERSNDAVITSRDLSEIFKKQHKNILQKIDSLKKRNPDVFTGLKIQPSYYKDRSGKKSKQYLLGRDAFMWFGMSFTGRRADNFRFKIIQAFNAMENWIQYRLEAKDYYKELCSVLLDNRQRAGKLTKPFHYANESRMINKIITGKHAPLNREEMTAEQLEILDELLQADATMLLLDMPYKERKEKLQKLFWRLTQ